MLRISLFTILLSVFLGSCGSPADPTPSQKDSGSNPYPQHPPASLPDTVATTGKQEAGNDSVIVLLAKEDTATLSADIQKDYQQIHVQIPVTHTRHLKVQLHAEGKERNVRISQIEMPDGKTDGPFGPAMEYTTKQAGTYILIIARNNMADGTVKGPVRIVIAKN